MSSFRPLIRMCPWRDHLPGLGPAGGEPQPGDHVVEPPLQQRHQGVARVARPAAGLRIVLAELPLEDPVVALDFLLLAEADGILAGLAAAKLMHARHPFATVHGALGGIAPRPLQEQLGALAAAEPANRSNMTSHGESAFLGRIEFVNLRSSICCVCMLARFLRTGCWIKVESGRVAVAGNKPWQDRPPLPLPGTMGPELRRGASWAAGSRCVAAA